MCCALPRRALEPSLLVMWASVSLEATLSLCDLNEIWVLLCHKRMRSVAKVSNKFGSHSFANFYCELFYTYEFR